MDYDLCTMTYDPWTMMCIHLLVLVGEVAEHSLYNVGHWRSGFPQTSMEHLLHWNTLPAVGGGQHRQREIISGQGGAIQDAWT